MSNAFPIVFLRPSCAAIRPSLPQQWSAARTAVKRSFSSIAQNSRCKSITCNTAFNVNSRTFIASSIPENQLRHVRTALRAFTTSRPQCATVSPSSKAKSTTRKIKIPPLPNGSVDAKTIHEIFGPTISQDEGNGILRIIHNRRVTGSLADVGISNLNKKYPQITDGLAMNGLEWLRKTYPIDEEFAAAEWAEKEAERLEEDLRRQRYKEMGLWKDGSEEVVEREENYTGEYKPGDKMGPLYEDTYKIETSEFGGRPTSQSFFERMRAENRAKRMEEAAIRDAKRLAAQKEEEEKIARGELVRGPLGLMKPDEKITKVFGVTVRDTSETAEALAMRKKAQVTNFETPEELEASMTTLQRLVPMTLFTIVVVGLSYLYATTYSPPIESYRLLRELPIPLATLLAIFSINYAVKLAWMVRPFWPFMNKYFVLVHGYPRFITAITNIFSHASMKHLMNNMAFLFTMGWWAHELTDRGTFLATYLSAGAIGSLASLYNGVFTRQLIYSSLGASGALYGITALALTLTNRDHFSIPFVDVEVPFRPLLILGGVVATDVWLLVARGSPVAAKVVGTAGGLDHWGHLGGMATGAVVGGWLKWVKGVGVEAGKVEEKVDVKEELNPIEGVE